MKYIQEAYEKEIHLNNLLVSYVFREKIMDTRESYHEAIEFAVKNGVYTPVLTSAYQYMNGYTCSYLETNLVQAQRDCFGAHTYQRIDKEGTFHTEWQENFL